MFTEKDQPSVSNENETESSSLDNMIGSNTGSIDTTNNIKKPQDNLLYDNMIFPS